MEFDQLASMWWFVQEFKKERKIIQKKKKKEQYRKEEKKFSSNFEKCNVRKEYCFEEEDLKKIMLNGNSKKS